MERVCSVKGSKTIKAVIILIIPAGYLISAAFAAYKTMPVEASITKTETEE